MPLVRNTGERTPRFTQREGGPGGSDVRQGRRKDAFADPMLTIYGRCDGRQRQKVKSSAQHRLRHQPEAMGASAALWKVQGPACQLSRRQTAFPRFVQQKIITKLTTASSSVAKGSHERNLQRFGLKMYPAGVCCPEPCCRRVQRSLVTIVPYPQLHLREGKKWEKMGKKEKGKKQQQ